MKAALFWVAFGFLLPQALWTRKTAPRFEDAKGERAGRFAPASFSVESKIPPLQVVGLGDSIIAGVGVTNQTEALVAQVCCNLQLLLNRPIAWQAHGKTGAKAGSIAKRACGLNWPPSTDVVLISTGVNDLLALSSIAQWRSSIESLVSTVRSYAPTAWIVFAGLPPMQIFPTLPRPLRWVLGWRAAHFDEVLAQTIASMDRVTSARIGPTVGPELLSADGFHPGASGYSRFGQIIAEDLALKIKEG